MNQVRKVCLLFLVSLGFVFTIFSSEVLALYGYDIHNTLAPAAGAMGGTSLARPQDLVSAIYANPATVTQFKGTQFTFGVTFFQPEVELKHDGSVTGVAYHADSKTDIFPVPEIGVTQDLSGLGIPAVLGIGLSATSGVGADFRDEPASLGTGAELIVFGVNVGGGYRLNERLSVGAMATVSFAQLDAGLSSTSAETHDFGYRGTFGLTYDLLDDTTVGVYYQMSQRHEFDNLFQTGLVGGVLPTFENTSVEQPANFGIGIANSSLLDGNLLLAFDYIFKNWEEAAFWEDIYEDQHVFALGGQYSMGKWRFRCGYSYAEQPNIENPTKLGSLAQVVTGPGGLVLPVAGNTALIQYLQATQAELIWEHRLSAGFGYKDFLMPGLDADLQMGWFFENNEDFGTHTTADSLGWHAGAALTWRF